MWEKLCASLPSAYRPIPFWSWNDRLDPETLRRQIRDMKRLGMGGFFMHARGGLVTEYMGDEWFEAVRSCVDEAEKLGMHAWCYDENGWPSGFAGMQLLEDPENHVHYLTCEERPEFDAAALAVYLRQAGALVRVSAPAGGAESYICVYDKTDPSFVDIVNPEVTDKFIALTHEEYRARCGDLFGGALAGFFTDEPQYYRYDTAYSPILHAEFQKAYGMDLLNGLGLLFVDTPDAPAFRHRYWSLMNRLFTENFAGRVYDWCERHGLQSTGHAIEEGSLFGQMWCCAGIMPFYEYQHIPGIDWLTRVIGTELAPRQALSAAMQLGKKQIISETFACCGWDATPAELKRIAEWQYVNGVNLMCHHLYPYSIRGQRGLDHPPFFSPCNPWVEEALPEFNEYFSSLGYLLAESREDAPVGVLHPLHSAYLTYRRGEDHASIAALEDSFAALVETLGREQIAHHFLDESLLSKHGRVDGARLILGACAYTAVVIPEMESVDSTSVRLLREFARAGGRICLAGTPPARVDGALSGELDFLSGAAMDFSALPRPFARLNRSDTCIRSTCRRSEHGDFLYAVNLSEEETYQVVWTLNAKGIKRFDPLTKAYTPVYFLREASDISVPVTLAPRQSFVWILEDSAEPAAPPAPVSIQRYTPHVRVTVMTENTLTMDRACLSYDGEAFEDAWPVEALNQRLLNEQNNQTIFLRYAFLVDECPAQLFAEADIPAGSRASLNGRMLDAPAPGRIEPLFFRYDLSGAVQTGDNLLTLEIPYYQDPYVYETLVKPGQGESVMNCLRYDTTISPVYLTGGFGVYSRTPFVPAADTSEPGKNAWLSAGPFAIGKTPKQVRPGTLLEEGFPFFAGSLTLTAELTPPDGLVGKSVRLRLDGGRWAAAAVRMNDGEQHKLVFTDSCDVTADVRPGVNTLDITLTNSNRNLMGPFHYAPDPEPYAVGPSTFTLVNTWVGNFSSWEGRESELYRPESSFVLFGLNGVSLEWA